MEIILLEYPESTTFSGIEKYLEYLTAPRRNGVLKKKTESGRINTLLSRLLLLWELEQRTGIKQSEIEFTRGTHGKPYLKGGDLQFSLSHTANAICVAFSDKGEIGIDIERKNRRVRPELYKNVLCEQELAAVSDIPFTRFWVQKEAFLKRLGLGITQDLRGVNSFTLPNTAAVETGGYYIGISANEPPVTEVTTLTLPELLGRYRN